MLDTSSMAASSPPRLLASIDRRRSGPIPESTCSVRPLPCPPLADNPGSHTYPPPPPSLPPSLTDLGQPPQLPAADFVLRARHDPRRAVRDLCDRCASRQRRQPAAAARWPLPVRPRRRDHRPPRLPLLRLLFRQARCARPGALLCLERCLHPQVSHSSVNSVTIYITPDCAYISQRHGMAVRHWFSEGDHPDVCCPPLLLSSPSLLPPSPQIRLHTPAFPHLQPPPSSTKGAAAAWFASAPSCCSDSCCNPSPLPSILSIHRSSSVARLRPELLLRPLLPTQLLQTAFAFLSQVWMVYYYQYIRSVRGTIPNC